MVVPIKSLLKSLAIFSFTLTPKRLINIVQIYLSMFLSKIFRRQIVWGYPPILMVEPTNICNLKCPMCPSGSGDMKRELGKMNFDDFKKIIDEIGPYIIQVQLWNQGEPFINRSFIEFIAYANSKGIMTHTSTNGHYIRTDEQAEALINSGLDQLIFSMDGTNKESYEKYRVGGNFDVVLEALERIARVKIKLNSKTPLVELQFIIFKHNQSEIDEIISLSKKFRLNRLSFKTAQVYSVDQAVTFLPDDSDQMRYDFDGSNFQLKGDIKNWCKRLWLNSTVNWDGSISPCCFDKDADHAFGNMFQHDTCFKKIWRNSKYQAFRKKVMQNRSSITMCTNCTEGLPEPYTKIIEINDLEHHVDKL
jgi:radical SAM protein with 4Fe4S-binding SPASM domain